MRNLYLTGTATLLAVFVLKLADVPAGIEQEGGAGGQASSQKTPPTPKPIRSLIAAFNAADPQRMGEVVDEKLEVRYVDKKGNSTMGSKDRKTLITQMKDYFKNVKAVRSELSQVSIAGRFVSARETVSWDSNGKRRSQYSLVVFELDSEKKLLRRVWYYPHQTDQ